MKYLNTILKGGGDNLSKLKAYYITNTLCILSRGNLSTSLSFVVPL